MAEAENQVSATDAIPTDGVPTEPVPEKVKKAKPPALEEKPFNDFMSQDYMPALKKALAGSGVENADLAFVKQLIPVRGYASLPECWQVQGKWKSALGPRQFNLYFFDEALQGQRGFSYTESTMPSTMESFRIDERKLTLDLLVLGTIQRLDAQKWLLRN
jgi:hypothetical protein